MKTLFLILILCIIALVCIYACISVYWRGIDTVSSSAVKEIRTVLDPDFNAVRFKKRVCLLLSELAFLNGNKVIFHTPFYERGKNRKILNAHAGLPGQKLVLFTPGWAVRLDRAFSLSENAADRQMIIDLFVYALGHELTHREAQYKPLFVLGKKRVCAAWIREVHADFGGMTKAGLPPERIRACVETELLGRRCQGADVSARARARTGKFHPTWEYRLSCMEAGNFSESTIDRICRDLGVTDKKFCEKMKRFYAARRSQAA